VVSLEKLITLAYRRKNYISYLEIRISNEIWNREIRRSTGGCEAEVRIRKRSL
jgi:hypothetical protein